MNLPEELQVSGIVYKISIEEGLQYNHSVLGQVLYHKGLIQLDSSMCEERKEQTYIHEMLHAIFYEAGYEEQDEDMINRVGKVLYQVLKDNDFK